MAQQSSSSSSVSLDRINKMMGHLNTKPSWPNKLVMLGAGVNGKCILPLVFEHVNIKPNQVTVISADDKGKQMAERCCVDYVVAKFSRSNYKEILGKYLSPGDFLLNMSVCVGSIDLVEFCQLHKIVYLDASLEPWGHGFVDPNLSPLERSNYKIRQDLLNMRDRLQAFEGHTTAVVAHGANPGLAESFTKQALVDIAESVDGKKLEKLPRNRKEWAQLAHRLGIKVVQVCERDNQQSTVPKKIGEFIQTWSPFGFFEELLQPAELGWGTHEKTIPEGALTHTVGNKAAILLNKPSAAVLVRTWCPTPGPHFGTLTTHHECLEVADYLTLRDVTGKPVYRPTVMYAYHPCDDSVLSVRELEEHEYATPEKFRVILPPYVVPGGFDEVGVLLLGHAKTGYWYGCHNTIEQVAKLLPGAPINATTFPVIFGIIAGIRWACSHPNAGIVEPVDMDHTDIIGFVKPILGCFGTFCSWNPIQNRTTLISTAKIDTTDPWQFCNFAV